MKMHSFNILQDGALQDFLNEGEVPLDNNVTYGALRSFS